MTNRTLFRLLIALLVLGGVAYLMNRKPAERVEVGGVTAGDTVFSELDVNNINAIELASISATITLARAESGWVVSSLYDYPAEFPPIANFLRNLNDLKVDQVLREGEATLKEVGLDPDVMAPDRLAVRLRYATGKPEVAFTLGAQKSAGDASGMGMGMPRGRFMQLGDGPVIAVEEGFFDLGQRSENWVNQELPRLEPAEVAEIEVRRADGGFTIALGEGGVGYVLRDAAQNEEVNESAASRIFSAMQWARFETVLDPSITDEEAGLDGTTQVSFRTTNDVVYVMEFAATGDATGRFTRISVRDAGEEGANAALVDEANAKLGAWRFKLSSSTVNQLMPARESLVTIKQPGTEAASDAADDETEEAAE
jgi:hypothetical protein